MSPSFANTTLADFAARLADKVPSPGGGAVAAVTLAHGAALGAMVLRYTVGRPSFAAHEAQNTAALAELDAMRATALALADRDAAAYARLAALWKLPEDDATRAREFQPAVREAIDAPQAIVDLAHRACALLAELPARTNARLGSDLAIAANLAALAADAAEWNVRVNLPSLSDAAAARAHGERTASQVAAAHELANRAVAAVRSRAS
ncbi:MAG: cyclodeaminase/cyclohydrolase family protein [Phycisphaerales bacterium]